MRYLYILLFFLVAAGGYCIYSPDDVSRFREYVSNSYHGAFIEKRVSLRGLRTLRTESIHARVPKDRSIPWWIANTGQIEASLKQISYIQEAKVTPCEGWISTWGCFVIDIVERSPMYLAPVGSDISVLGEDGAAIVTIPVANLERELENLLDQNTKKPKMLVDMITPGVSSDVVHARFSYLSQGISIVEAATKREVSRVQLLPNGEILVRMRGLPFEIQFDETSRDVPRLKDEAERLRVLLQELRGRESEVKKVDLAYDRLAVVTFTDEAMKAQLSQKALHPKK